MRKCFLPPNLHPPNVTQWNASVQHLFGDNWVVSVSYLGNKTSHLWIGNEINPAVYIPGTCAGKPCSSTSNTQARRVLSLANPTAGQYYSANDHRRRRHQRQLQRSADVHRAPFRTQLHIPRQLHVVEVSGYRAGYFFGHRRDPEPQQRAWRLRPCTYDVPQLFNTSVVYSSQFGHGGLVSASPQQLERSRLWCATQSGLPVNPSIGKRQFADRCRP